MLLSPSLTHRDFLSLLSFSGQSQCFYADTPPEKTPASRENEITKRMLSEYAAGRTHKRMQLTLRAAPVRCSCKLSRFLLSRHVQTTLQLEEMLSARVPSSCFDSKVCRDQWSILLKVGLTFIDLAVDQFT